MVTRDEMELRYQSLAGLLAKNSSSKKVLVDATSYGMALLLALIRDEVCHVDSSYQF